MGQLLVQWSHIWNYCTWHRNLQHFKWSNFGGGNWVCLMQNGWVLACLISVQVPLRLHTFNVVVHRELDPKGFRVWLMPCLSDASGASYDIAGSRRGYIFPQGCSSYFFLKFAHLWWFGVSGLRFWIGSWGWGFQLKGFRACGVEPSGFLGVAREHLTFIWSSQSDTISCGFESGWLGSLKRI